MGEGRGADAIKIANPPLSPLVPLSPKDLSLFSLPAERLAFLSRLAATPSPSFAVVDDFCLSYDEELAEQRLLGSVVQLVELVPQAVGTSDESEGRAEGHVGR